MPKIEWRDLPTELRQHLFDRAKERGITSKTFLPWRSGASILRTFLKGHGTKILAHSSSAAKADIRRLSCCGVNQRMASK
jgi:hypothetical protein